jgi:hypothetical protein
MRGNLSNRVKRLETESTPSGEKIVVLKGSADSDFSKLQGKIERENQGCKILFINLLSFRESGKEPRIVATH